ncbi:MAG: hypothetical protein AAB426_13125 [Myxococcota bacterium]
MVENVKLPRNVVTIPVRAAQEVALGHVPSPKANETRTTQPNDHIVLAKNRGADGAPKAREQAGTALLQAGIRPTAGATQVAADALDGHPASPLWDQLAKVTTKLERPQRHDDADKVNLAFAEFDEIPRDALLKAALLPLTQGEENQKALRGILKAFDTASVA